MKFDLGVTNARASLSLMLCLIGALLFVPPVAASMEPINLVRNSSFEFGTSEWDLGGFGWQRERVNGRMSIRNEFSFSGQRSILLEFNDESGPHRYVTTAQRISVKPHTRYRITVKSYSRGLARNGASIIVNSAWDNRPIVFAGGSDQQWQHQAGEFTTGPERFIDLRLLIENRGRIWLDDITLAEFTAAEDRIPKAVRFTSSRSEPGMGGSYDLPIYYETEPDSEAFVQEHLREEARNYSYLVDADVFEFLRGPSRRQNCVGFVTQRLWERTNPTQRQFNTEFLSRGVQGFYENVLRRFGDRIASERHLQPNDIAAFVQTPGGRAVHVGILDYSDDAWYVLSKDQWDSVFAVRLGKLRKLGITAKYFNDAFHTVEYYRLDPGQIRWEFRY